MEMGLHQLGVRLRTVKESGALCSGDLSRCTIRPKVVAESSVVKVVARYFLGETRRRAMGLRLPPQMVILVVRRN